jgi:hypothetical protein
VAPSLVLAGGLPISYCLFFLRLTFLPPVALRLCLLSREIPIKHCQFNRAFTHMCLLTHGQLLSIQIQSAPCPPGCTRLIFCGLSLTSALEAYVSLAASRPPLTRIADRSFAAIGHTRLMVDCHSQPDHPDNISLLHYSHSHAAAAANYPHFVLMHDILATIVATLLACCLFCF